LFSEEFKQKFYDKRVLWQYLKDNHGLNCSQSNFRKYIVNKVEFQSYFESEKRRSSYREVIRFEKPPAEQAQLDRKESILYIVKQKGHFFENYLAGEI